LYLWSDSGEQSVNSTNMLVLARGKRH